MRKIIVDIDNTLWDLAPVFYEKLHEVNPEIPPPARWHAWDFWKGFVPERVLYGILQDIHSRQDAFAPYPEAKPFLSCLKEKGFYIIIASHREKGTFDAAQRWLIGNDLPFDEVHLSYDKTVLFDECWAIVDDSPVTLEKARAAGIVRVGLKNPWNEKEDHPLFENLPEALNYLQSRCLQRS
ncbi:MAG: HAD family hydrolase [Dehalococcoidia bacterium]|nr:MAG: HAD family hydrolase [Dehalococcoidia bacterium]